MKTEPVITTHISTNDQIIYDIQSSNEEVEVFQGEILHASNEDNSLKHTLFYNNSSIDLEDDHDDCIDVQDDSYELQEKISLSEKKRGRPKKNRKSIKLASRKLSKPTLASEKLSKLKTAKSKAIRTSKSLREKEKHLKKKIHSRSTKSFEKHINDCSNALILKTSSTEFAKKTQTLTSYNKYEKNFRKYQQNTNGCLVDETTQTQEFPHLFKPAPKPPVETKDGQRLGKKYRKKYNTGDLRYVHVHRQATRSKEVFSDTNQNKNKDDMFDILSLVPREVIPAITSNSQLGFREPIIDKRLMRYKRGIPIFRVGRKIPGELS